MALVYFGGKKREAAQQHKPSTLSSHLRHNQNKPRQGHGQMTSLTNCNTRWILRTELIILVGNLNTHISTNHDGWEETMGKFGICEINDKRLHHLLFASINQLVIGNRIF